MSGLYMFNVIFWPREQSRYSSDYHIDLWKNGKIEIVKALEPTDIPVDPDWTEDPFESRIWSAYYQSLGWAYAGEAAFKAGEFEEFPEFIKNLILDFASDNLDLDNPNHPLTFHDGSNAFRVANISYWYETYLKPGNGFGVGLSAEEEQKLADSIAVQKESLLYQISKEEHWEGNNHRFFHSMSLSSYATVFGNVDPSSPLFEEDAQELLETGLSIVEDTIGDFVYTGDGVTAEQSFTYHRVALGLVLEAIQGVVDAGYTLDVDFVELITKMFEFDMLSRRPVPEDGRYDLYVSEIGDTYFGGLSGSFIINQVLESGDYRSPAVDWMLSEGEEGTRPDDLNYFDEAGYVIIRPEYEWENVRDLRVIVDASGPVHSHGHYDNSNVILSMFGERILVDSGGPYSYDNINPLGYDFAYRESLKQFYFVTSEAHNVVVVDGFSSDSETVVNHVVDTETVSYVSLEREFAYVPEHLDTDIPHGVDREEYYQGIRDNYDPITLDRDVVVLKNSGITFVFDQMTNFGTDSHDYTLNWHFDPAAVGIEAGEQLSFSQNGVFADAAFAGSDGLEFAFYEGFADEDEMQGWVTPGLYELVEAPVIEMKVTNVRESAWFASAFSASLTELPELQMDVLHNAAGGYTAYLSYDGFYNVVATDGLGGIAVHEYEGASKTGHETVVFADAQASRNKIGTDGFDWFVGTEDDDVLYAFSGDDLTVGGAGNDRIDAGEGDDTSYGEDGDDVIYDLSGNNFVDDGDGNDRVQTGDGDDTVNNGAGDDLIATGAGDDIVRAGGGTDRYLAGEGYDTFVVDAVKDEFLFEIRDDHLLLWDRNAANGDLGRNYLFDVERIQFAGSDDNIFIDDETVNDYRDSVGNDTFVLGAGDDRIYAGTGFDTVIVQGSRDHFYFEDRGTYVVVMDRNVDDGDFGRNYLYDVDSIVFADDTVFV